MNHEKAREYFSAYYEKNLEEGLRQTLQQRLGSDPQLMAEYRAFERTMGFLSGLADETIEVPTYLNNRISARLEVGRATRKPSVWDMLRLRPLAFVGLAAVALIGTVFAIRESQAGGPFGAGTVAPGNAKATTSLLVQLDHGVPVATFESKSADRVQVVLDNQTIAGPFTLLPGSPFRVKLVNPNSRAASFRMLAGDATIAAVAVPGTSRETTRVGTGSIQDLADALADHFGKTIVVRSAGDGKTLSWNMTGKDTNVSKVAREALDGSQYTVSEMAPDVVTLGIN